jgi:hypothetical protein
VHSLDNGVPGTGEGLLQTLNLSHAPDEKARQFRQILQALRDAILIWDGRLGRPG